MDPWRLSFVSGFFPSIIVWKCNIPPQIHVLEPRFPMGDILYGREETLWEVGPRERKWVTGVVGSEQFRVALVLAWVLSVFHPPRILMLPSTMDQVTLATWTRPCFLWHETMNPNKSSLLRDDSVGHSWKCREKSPRHVLLFPVFHEVNHHSFIGSYCHDILLQNGSRVIAVVYGLTFLQPQRKKVFLRLG